MTQQAIDNRNPAHRQALISALVARGLEAHEEQKADAWRVSVYLVRQEQDQLAICTANEDAACEIGLTGTHGRKEAGTDFINCPADLEAAVALFEWHWEDRESWIDMYQAGALDYNLELN